MYEDNQWRQGHDGGISVKKKIRRVDLAMGLDWIGLDCGCIYDIQVYGIAFQLYCTVASIRDSMFDILSVSAAIIL